MIKTTIIVSALVLCLAIATHAAPPSSGAQASGVQSLGTITRSQMAQQMNKPMTFEGYFYDGSIPMLVQSMELVQGNTPLPPDKYIPIVGPIPSSFKPGAKVRIGGQMQAPTGERLQGEGVSLQVTAQSQAVVVQASPPSAAAGSAQLFTGFRAPVTVPVLTKRYALLIGGGRNSANDYPRYWNDLWMMYQILIAAGYQPANIRVAYSSGLPRGGGMPVNYSATTAGIQAAFTYLAPRVKASDTLYIMIVGQCAPPGDIGPTPMYWTWPGMPMSPSALAIQVNKIATCKQMTIQMGQAFSGAFIPLLMKPNRVIIASSAAYKDSYCHPSYLLDNFEYWYMSALVGHQVIGGAPLNADANGSGQVSLGEAYNYTLPRPGGAGIPAIAWQMPQFEDTGTPPSRFGAVPGAGEGLVGAVTYL